jgi:hypothetical protein
MGSTLSIVNNTPDEWYCNIRSDEAAINVVSILGTVVSVVGAVATAGTSLAIVPAAAGAGSAAAITGLTVTTAAKIAKATSNAATYSGALMGMSTAAATGIQQAGYTHILPGNKMTSGKMTLSLWQQGTCMKVTENPSKMAVTIHTLYMRPIFSGATDDSDLEHDIQWWINKWGTSDQEILVTNPEGKDWATIDVNAPLILNNETQGSPTFPVASPTLPPMSDLSTPPTSPSPPSDGSAVPTSYVPTVMDGTTVPSPKPTLDLSSLMPSPPPMESTTPLPTNPVTSNGSAQVSTETTGPPTAANRPPTVRA